MNSKFQVSLILAATLLLSGAAALDGIRGKTKAIVEEPTARGFRVKVIL